MSQPEIGLSTSSMSFTLGHTGRGSSRVNSSPMSIQKFFEFAFESGYVGVELPFQRFYPSLDPGDMENARTDLLLKGFYTLVDSDKACDLPQIRSLIPIATMMGSKIIRIKTSNVLACDRKQLPCSWTDYVTDVIKVLKEIAPEIKTVGLKIAIENHQDMDSRDLERIIDEVGDDVVGVNFDIGNAFATFEDPVAFAKRFGSQILNIHLKDYKIFRSNRGYRLARCAIGDGAVEFSSLLQYFKGSCPEAKLVVETGALESREITINDPNFWDHLPPRSDAEMGAFQDFLENHQLDDDIREWATPWENSEPPEKIIDYEKSQITQSIDYLMRI